MKVYTHTEPGGHATNEDRLGVISFSDDSPVSICALADGQGGQSGGARAAQIAVESCFEAARTHTPSELFNPSTWTSIGEAVDENVSLDSEAGYATFIGLAVTPSFAAGVSCGDGAVALLLGDEFFQLTERQQKNPPVGSGTARWTPFSARLDKAWKMLIISDGVWKFTGWEAIAEKCRAENGKALIANLRELVAANTGGELLDDFSVILIES